MPNIFGKEQHQYGHLRKIADKKMLDAHNAALKVRGRVHDFQALNNPLRASLNDTEAAAQALSFVTNNYQAIMAEVEEILYTDFRLPGMLPLKTSGIPDGAQSYAYKVVNKYGQGKFIDNDGKTANSATVSMGLVPYTLEYGGIIPEWSIEDVRNAAFAGIALDTTTIQAGTEGCMDHIEQVAFIGDTARSFEGLTNHSEIPSQNSAKTFANMSALEMVQFVQTGVTGIITGTEEVFGRVIKTGMTLYLPVAQADLLMNTNYADDATKTVWDYVSVNNSWTKGYTGQPLKLEIVKEFAGAGAGSTDRCLFGCNNDRVMEMAIPIMPRVINTIEQAYGVVAPMEYKVSGLNVKRGTSMDYWDAI